jgi:hypothetical protein
VAVHWLRLFCTNHEEGRRALLQLVLRCAGADMVQLDGDLSVEEVVQDATAQIKVGQSPCLVVHVSHNRLQLQGVKLFVGKEFTYLRQR